MLCLPHEVVTVYQDLLVYETYALDKHALRLLVEVYRLLQLYRPLPRVVRENYCS